jgi:hypothetical protein
MTDSAFPLLRGFPGILVLNILVIPAPMPGFPNFISLLSHQFRLL